MYTSVQVCTHTPAPPLCSFPEAMKQLSLAGLVRASSAPPPSLVPSLAPPTCLLDYPPLAVLTNAILAGLNEVRQCAPVAVGPELARETRRLLDSTVHDIAELHRYHDLHVHVHTHTCRV